MFSYNGSLWPSVTVSHDTALASRYYTSWADIGALYKISYFVGKGALLKAHEARLKEYSALLRKSRALIREPRALLYMAQYT